MSPADEKKSDQPDNETAALKHDYSDTGLVLDMNPEQPFCRRCRRYVSDKEPCVAPELPEAP